MIEVGYRNTMFSPEYNLDVAIGGIEFRDRVIKNLREQIKNLQTELLLNNVSDARIYEIQYAHQYKDVKIP